MDVVPVLLVDFLPPLQVLQVVVTEFVSPHQPRPTLAAIVMGEVQVFPLPLDSFRSQLVVSVSADILAIAGPEPGRSGD